MIWCKVHVISMSRPARPGRSTGSLQVTGRDVKQPAGDMPSVLRLSLKVFYASAIKENRRENDVCFRVRGAVMMIRPLNVFHRRQKTSEGLRANLFQPP